MVSFKKAEPKKNKTEQTSLGFEEESRFKTLKSSLLRKFKRLNKEAKYSGIYNNFWLWNVVFLNLAIAFILGILIFTNYSRLPQAVGITLDNIRRYDSIIDKEFLYGIVIFHVLVAFITLLFGIKAQKKLNHLIIAAFFNFAVLGFYEFFAIRDLIYYFIQ